MENFTNATAASKLNWAKGEPPTVAEVCQATESFKANIESIEKHAKQDIETIVCSLCGFRAKYESGTVTLCACLHARLVTGVKPDPTESPRSLFDGIAIKVVHPESSWLEQYNPLRPTLFLNGES